MSKGSRRQLGFWISTVAAVAVACYAAPDAPAQMTWYVDNTAEPPGNGSEENPFPTIARGIEEASDGDTVLVLDGTGTYSGPGNINLDFAFGLPPGQTRAITVRTQNGPEAVEIDCDRQAVRGFYFHTGEDPNSVVEGFKIKRASIHDPDPQQVTYGGAIWCENGSSPTVTNCIFEDNYADFGGGMYNDASSPIVIECVFDFNRATRSRLPYGRGGGMCNYNGSNPTVRNCTFQDNAARLHGGGMYNNNSDPTVINCVFKKELRPTGNSAARGGAIYNSNSNPIVVNCMFRENECPPGQLSLRAGGAMYNYGSGPIVTNCAFIDNKAYNQGGAMYNDGGSEPILTNCTFSGNEAGGSGGAMYNNASRPTVVNSILWADTPNEISPYLSATVTYSDVGPGLPYPGEGNITDDPNFVDPTNADYRLGPDSPCIDAADNTEVPPDVFDLDGDEDTAEPTPFDLDRRLRFVDRILTADTGIPDPSYPELYIVDMGAYEYQCTGDLDGDGDVDLSNLAELLSNYPTTSGLLYPDGDVHPEPTGIDPVGDGDVDLADLAALLPNYGRCAGRGRGGEGESRGPEGRGEGTFMRVFIEPYDTGGYQGGGFHGEVDHFVFDMKIEVFDPKDDWTASGALLDSHNDATFRLSSTPVEPDAYATFVAAPWVEVPGSPNGASIAGAYLPADPTHEFESTGINIAWFDMQDSHDGPATVLRLVIDVSAVEGADVSGGFGSVYFSYFAPGEPGDILVADLSSGSASCYGGGELVPLSGNFYVKAE